MPRQYDIKLEPKVITYPIYIGENLLQKDQFIHFLTSFKSSQYVIITDIIVEPLHARKLEKDLKSKGLNVSLIQFPPGEENKSRKTKEYCENQLLKLGATRDTFLIGIGGGIVTDVTGFVASTYCRGIPFVTAPTTLLAMVDASIGGKTGINVPEGKNLIGTIYQPTAVFIDIATLKTLPLSEIKNGISEMIKHGLIVDKKYFEFMKDHASAILNLDLSVLEEAIFESIRIKAHIVEKDETEKGMRRLLNFGHTVAHAIETATKHEIPHGRAVAIGMVAESYLAMKLGRLSQAGFETIREILDLYKIDLTWKGSLAINELLDQMKMDKKSLAQIPRFVILNEVGKAEEFDGQYCSTVNIDILKDALEWTYSNVMQS
ncbi:MAG: 3-dehydroquinate synthase [Nitrosopumilus sp.]|nr:3-dehydroquinate synthase [Nitrosopumilus sp.]